MGDSRRTLSSMRAARKSLENCADTIEELNHKLDEYINNNLKYQIPKAETDTAETQQKAEIRKDYNNKSSLKLKDYINNDLECQIQKVELEKNEIEKGYNNESLLKLINTTRKKIEKDKSNENIEMDVDNILSVLDKISDKLLDLEYYNATIINELVSYITEDPRIIRGTHLKKDSINKLIHDIDNLISDAEDYLDANELMILYFGIYLARIKNKEIRNKGVRKIVNTILHPPVQDLI